MKGNSERTLRKYCFAGVVENLVIHSRMTAVRYCQRICQNLSFFRVLNPNLDSEFPLNAAQRRWKHENRMNGIIINHNVVL